MRLFAVLRQDEIPFVDAWCRAGHDIWMERAAAVFFRQYNLPVQPVDVDDTVVEFPGVPDRIAILASQVAPWVRAFTFAHAQFKFDAVLVWTDAPGPQRAVVLTARSLGIPTFEITHGSLNTYRQGHFECDSYVDCVLAPGQEEVDFRRFYGVNVRVEVTGKPSYDWMASCDTFSDRKAVRERLHIPWNRPLVLYFMTWRHPFSTWERDTDLGESEVLKAHMALQSICSPYLIVKPHYARATPEHIERLRQTLNEAGIVEYAVTNADPGIVLPAMDLLIAHKSSMLVEAVLLGIPALGFDYREWNDHAFYKGRGIEWVSKRSDLLPAFTRCLLDRPTRDRLREERIGAASYFNGPNDGRAAERCVRAIESIATRAEVSHEHVAG